MASRTWRDKARPIIAEILKDHQDCDDATIKKALLEAYPFGARAHHPYKIWLDEIKRQRGTKYKVLDLCQLELFKP